MMLLPPNSPTAFESTMRRCVATAGAKWLGIQDPIFPDMNPVLTCTHPQTHALIALQINPFTYDENALIVAIAQKIGDDTERHENRAVRIPVRTLKQLADKLLKLSEEVDALYEEKR